MFALLGDIQFNLPTYVDGMDAQFGADRRWGTDCQVHALRGLFFRNKGAYLIGRLIDADHVDADGVQPA